MMKKVIVIGGGFAGSYISRKLEKKFDVTLIDSKDYFEFTPGILRTIVEPSHINKIQVIHTHYLKKAKVILGNVSEISKKYVIVNNKKIYFDYLVICSGSNYSPLFKGENIAIVNRAKQLRECYDKLCKSKKILIIGGGSVGVELAAEISTHYKDKKITIIHSKDKLIERNYEKAIKYAEKFLKKNNVRIVYNEKAIQKKDKFFITDKGNKFYTDLTFICAGITANYEFMKKEFSSSLNIKNQIKVNKFLQLVGEKNIFVAGDIAGVKEEKTAQNAEKMAKTVVKNILATEKKEQLEKYYPKSGPLVISLGKWDGIFSYKNINLMGFVIGLLKAFIEKKEMLKFK